MTAAIQPVSAMIDACSLQNFAMVGRLDLLEGRFGERLAWTQAVELEVKRGVQEERSLEQVLQCAWLGQAVDVTSGDVLAVVKVEPIRRALGGHSGRPFEHLGEAETIYYIENYAPSTIFVTDDRPALDFARNRQILVMNSAAVLSECHKSGEAGCPEAYQLLQQMAAMGRGVYVPNTHHEVC